MSDKRSIHTDALETLGTIIGNNEKRDAIHLAVEPAVAAEKLFAGQHVGFVSGGFGASPNPVGIVDPFLAVTVMPQQKFWLVVYPRKITSLRHVWEHPAFDAITEEDRNKAIAMRAIQDIGNSIADGVSASDLIEHASDYLNYEGYWSEGGRFEGEGIPSEFWDHYEVVTGEAVPQSKRGSFFSCSC